MGDQPLWLAEACTLLHHLFAYDALSTALVLALLHLACSMSDVCKSICIQQQGGHVRSLKDMLQA